ncbi:cytochrome c oxidase subunit 3 [Protofrankia coriariae]|uniref:cytochrome c oxidase subunit 3 n=1 Tax=Protofrankia coriariae TaxID=1562887 RepID=UPI00069C7CAA|nr:cytochrome c oxidase subunit 3 [Protofrankia coriariae]
MEEGNTDEREGVARRNTRPATGSEGIWIFVLMDMIVFALIFLVFTSERVRQYEVYRESHQHLNVVFGFANTLILLTSSLFVVQAVQAARRLDARQVSSRLTAALLLGLAFCADKAVEYSVTIGSGIGIATSSFFTFYFAITFIHLAHVLAGMSFMFFFQRNRDRLASDVGYLAGLENVGVFWHFVDLLWIFIYSLLYLT